MNFIEFLLCFLLGVVFTQWIFPLLDTFTSIVQTWGEAYKSKFAVHIAKNNDIINNLNNPPQEEHHLIGFQIPEEEDDDLESEEEEDDDDDT